MFYVGEARDLSSEFGSDLYTTTGDITVSKLDLDKHLVKFALKDSENYIWSDLTITEKAFEYYVVTGACGNSAAYNYADGKLTILGTGAISSFPWSSYAAQITEIVIGNGITSIVKFSETGISR